MQADERPTETPQRARPGRRWGRWVAAFLCLAAIVLVVVAVQRWNRQLDRKALEEARSRWDRQRPADYDMTFATSSRGSTRPDRFEVRVRGGKVVAVDLNGKAEASDRLHYHSMDRLFDYIEKFLELDQDPRTGVKKGAAWAEFDPRDGHLLRYRRQVLGGREGVDIEVECFSIP